MKRKELMQVNEEHNAAVAAETTVTATHSSGLSTFVSVLVFIILITALSVMGYRLFVMSHQLTRSIAALDDKVAQSQQQFSELQKMLADLQVGAQQSHDVINSQQQLLTDLRNAQQGKKDQWNIIEASFLTKLANETLQISGNVSQALALLKNADQELSHLTDPSVMLLRQALAADMLALQNVAVVDYAGLYLQLISLNEQIEKLPLIKLSSVSVVSEAPAENLTWWQRGLQQTEQVLRKLVVIRRLDNGMLPFITSEQKELLYQNLHAMLQQTMFALMQKQADIYRASLQQTIAWLKQYFVQDAPTVVSALGNLAQLQAINIQVSVPSLQAPQAFQDYFATQSKS